VVGIGVREPDPAQISQIDARPDRLQIRTRQDEGPGVHEHRLLGAQQERVDGDEPQPGHRVVRRERLDACPDRAGRDLLYRFRHP